LIEVNFVDKPAGAAMVFSDQTQVGVVLAVLSDTFPEVVGGSAAGPDAVHGLGKRFTAAFAVISVFMDTEP